MARGGQDGRTHLEDATPLTVGQEWSGYARQIEQGIDRLEVSMAGLYELAMGLRSPLRTR